jgi:hypothetical protein
MLKDDHYFEKKKVEVQNEWVELFLFYLSINFKN